MFLHEDSDICKRGDLCDIVMCCENENSEENYDSDADAENEEVKVKNKSHKSPNKWKIWGFHSEGCRSYDRHMYYRLRTI